MARTEKSVLKCLLLWTPTRDLAPVREVASLAAKEAGVQLVSLDDFPLALAHETVFAEITNADLILALVSGTPTTVFYEVGMAHALGKPVVFVAEKDAGLPTIGPTLVFDRPLASIDLLRQKIRDMLVDFSRNPTRLLALQRRAIRQTALPVIDLDRLEPREIENLCFELLTQMGFRRVEWGKEIKEVDVVATLPKKDPDGFEYQELWLISMGLHVPPSLFVEMTSDPDYLLHTFFRPEFAERFRSTFKPDGPITLLLILLRTEGSPEYVEQEIRRAERRLAGRRYPPVFRFRTWDRQYLASLIQQYPQLASKYFSEEGRAQSKSRKTTEELYRETVALNERLQAANTALKEEREKRVRAERDAVWKDVAFKAAHKLGNPIFALETDLQGLRRRIENKPEEALEVANEMRTSIEKAKGIIEQFKSLTRAQEISKRRVDLVPIIQAAARVASENGAEVAVQSDGNSTVLADPTRMTECFDELFANALHWFDKPEKKISVTIGNAKKKNLPPELDDSKSYVRIRFSDNGCGIPAKMKKDIFAPFCTTHPHGTGLGLSMVERVIQGHDGAIREVGDPGQNAVFEIFLPRNTSTN